MDNLKQENDDLSKENEQYRGLLEQHGLLQPTPGKENRDISNLDSQVGEGSEERGVTFREKDELKVLKNSLRSKENEIEALK